MSEISNKPLDNISEEDLHILVQYGVLESKDIEYKKSLPNFIISKEKKEFLADVSSFANASGGDLIYGIEENKGVPTNLCGLEIPETEMDKLKRQIEGIIRLNIGPRIPGILIQPLKLRNGRYAIIIRIPKSWASPHMVTIELKDHERFFSRTSSGKYPLDVTELRAAFMLSETMAERIKNFRMDRISNLLSGEAPVPMGDDPKIALHVIPFTSFDLTQVIPLSSLEKVAREVLPTFFHLSNFRVNLDGYLKYGSDGYLQFFRNGIIEVVGIAASKSDMQIPALDFDCMLHDALPTYISAQEELGLSPPFLVTLSLLSVRDCRIYVPPRWHPSPDQKIDRDVLLLTESIIENFEFELDKVLKQILDPLWNASGYNGSPHFDQDSEKWIVINY
jgi:hypothetical protein